MVGGGKIKKKLKSEKMREPKMANTSQITLRYNNRKCEPSHGTLTGLNSKAFMWIDEAVERLQTEKCCCTITAGCFLIDGQAVSR